MLLVMLYDFAQSHAIDYSLLLVMLCDFAQSHAVDYSHAVGYALFSL
jgi:hypothetical protein